MHATEVIEMYVADTVRFLPRRQRDDVAAELRTLLSDELQARAWETGRPPDEALALSLVRGYGRPNEAAARYRSPWSIVDPADSTSFLRAAIVGTAALVLLGSIGRRLPAPRGASSNDAVGIGILTWLGLLVVVFGLKNLIRSRRPEASPWKPRDRDRASLLGAAAVVLIASPWIVLYAAPATVLGWLSGGRLDTSWAAFTADFQRFGHPCLIGLQAGLLALLVFVGKEGRWCRYTRRLNIVLNAALAGLVLLLAASGNVFQSSLADRIAREVLALVAAVYVPCVGVQVYGEIGRLDRVAAEKKTIQEI